MVSYGSGRWGYYF